MEENQQANISSWDDFLDNWLKADMVVTTPATFICIKVRADKTPDGKPQVVLGGEFNKKKCEFSLNITNMKRSRDLKISNPQQLVGKKLILIKVKVRDPKGGGMIDSLYIDKIE